MSDAKSSPPALEITLGTAGHIDHGKTELIRALTGIDTDRLPEEKRRGITIELGFAPLDLGDGRRLSVIDVPGHEGLVRTMVAGATGIDLVLLVVAADEGVMPQTREHLATCELLGLERGVVALTKTDLVERDIAELAATEVEELIEASSLRGAPVVPVSARSGEGVDDLRETLRKAVDGGGAVTSRSGPPRLAVDRVFSARGFGCVVTGTLLGGELAVGDAVVLEPGGRRARVRGLERFGEKLERAAPGARTAVNLQGIEGGDVARGDVVTRPDALAPTPLFDARLEWLPGAPPGVGLVSVELLCGTSERRARIGAIGEESIRPGESGLARVHVEGDPLALLPGDRFVVRGFGSLATLGGGRVLDVAPPHRRRSDPRLRAELETLDSGDEAAGIALRVARSGFSGLSVVALSQQTGRDADALRETRGAREPLTETPAGVWLDAHSLEALADTLVASLEDWHRREPLRPGMPRSALAGMLPENAAAGAFDLALASLEASGRARAEGDLVWLTDFVAMLSQEQEAMAAHLRASAMAAGLEPPTSREWAKELHVDSAALADLLAYLEREGSLVRAPGDLWFDRGAVDELRERVIAALREHGSLDTTAYKTLIGTTRKYAVPLMELFDSEHLTVRQADHRRLKRG